MLHSFGSGTDGTGPTADLIDVKGTLYGTTEEGGAYNAGTVFSITTSGAEKVLYSFTGDTDGDSPQTGLIDIGGKLYGTTFRGGAHNDGTVFNITTRGRERVLHSFRANGIDGELPEAGLTDVNGTLYGTTIAGGGSDCSNGYGCGTVFSITTNGTEKVLYSFGGGSDRASPGQLDHQRKRHALRHDSGRAVVPKTVARSSASRRAASRTCYTASAAAGRLPAPGRHEL